jgi:hypothetical protein
MGTGICIHLRLLYEMLYLDIECREALLLDSEKLQGELERKCEIRYGGGIIWEKYIYKNDTTRS